MGRSAYPNLGKLGLGVLIIRGSSVRARPAPPIELAATSLCVGLTYGAYRLVDQVTGLALTTQ